MSAGVAGTTSFRPTPSYTTLRDVTFPRHALRFRNRLEGATRTGQYAERLAAPSDEQDGVGRHRR
jgi:hypothetical protein